MTDTQQPANDTANNKKNVLWVYLSGAMAITIVVMMFMPNSGMGGSIIAIYGPMLWCGIFAAALARYNERNGWIGFAIGSGIGMLLQVISQIV
ncbi:hypothetical protein FJ444_09160 [Aestuariibacter sp. GS-14]|uniref:hypothetical protein n=1 Tax=Alteromonadaceae TaxID=72275 RepID=UPI0011264238|nr:hypothetical protein [Aestuariibacter sp. GS-14]TPV59200.1 hypothetical protein FJ444_09160 [Aestuariibacter sp. GS-14]